MYCPWNPVFLIAAPGKPGSGPTRRGLNTNIERSSLVVPWKEISDDDLNCADLYFIAEKVN